MVSVTCRPRWLPRCASWVFYKNFNLRSFLAGQGLERGIYTAAFARTRTRVTSSSGHRGFGDNLDDIECCLAFPRLPYLTVPKSSARFRGGCGGTRRPESVWRPRSGQRTASLFDKVDFGRDARAAAFGTSNRYSGALLASASKPTQPLETDFGLFSEVSVMPYSYARSPLTRPLGSFAIRQLGRST